MLEKEKNKIAERLKHCRISSGLSISELKVAMHNLGLAISEQTIRNWERGRCFPDVLQMKYWFKALGTNPVKITKIYGD